jgi:ribosomal protein L7Ae-like RNA K-turn-binding protein
MSAPDRSLGLLGLAVRAGALVSGVEKVREGIRSGRIRFVIVARDVSANSRGKLLPLLDANRVQWEERFDRAELGRAVGRESLSVVGVTDASFAARLQMILANDRAI